MVEKSNQWHVDPAYGMRTPFSNIITVKNLILLLVFLLSPMILYIIFSLGYSGVLRWIVMLFIVSVVGISAIRYIWNHSIQVPKLTHNPNLNQCFYGDLTKLASTMKRASNGLLYSQIVIVKRIKDAFLEKLAISRNLSPTDLKKAIKDKEELMTLIGDQELVDFSLKAVEIDEKWDEYLIKWRNTKKGKMLKKDAKYRDINYIEKMLEKMEAWE